MVHIVDGNSEMGAHVRSDPGYPIRLGHLFRSREVKNLFFLVRTVFLYTSETPSDLLSYISTEDYSLFYLTSYNTEFN